MQTHHLTENEKRILAETYGDSERLANENLYEYQEIALEQLRTATRYLDEKYPGHTLRVNSFDPANKYNGHATLILLDEAEKSYTLTVSAEVGTYQCTDDYYSVFLRGRYDDYIRDLLMRGGWDALCHTDFPELRGKEITGKEEIPEILEQRPPLMKTTHIFLYNDTDHEIASKEVENIFRNAAIYGSCTLFFVSGQADRDIAVLEKSRREFQRHAFNYFDAD